MGKIGSGLNIPDPQHWHLASILLFSACSHRVLYSVELSYRGLRPVLFVSGTNPDFSVVEPEPEP